MPIVIGVGDRFRRDDGAGPAVVEALRGRTPDGVTLAVTDGEPARLIELWAGADLAIVVDAVRAEPCRPGHVHEIGPDTALRSGGVASSHTLGLGEAVALGRAVDRMPGALRVLAIEGAEFGWGCELTPPVAAAVEAVAERIVSLLARRRAPQGGRGMA
ncbi:hydrogenase maturation protease [Actinomadura miaoliensis]|uniref:Hydrogenase maturation protease n=1 Tax=Actinomadura miaoliensis TaxID=430685 RepID=A0ABP7VYP8_9ACTN